MTAFRMPSLGADMDEGTLVEWLKQPGDQLKRGDIVAVVETQKGAIEIEVFQDGVLETIHVKLGAKVPVGEVLATIRTSGEPEAPQPTLQKAAPPEPPPPKPLTVPHAPVAAPRTTETKISPAARHRAEGLGIDLHLVSPGRDGIIGLRELEMPGVRAQPKTAQGINLDEMRKAIAAAMARSKREIPHYYVSFTIDMTPLMDWLAAENASRAVPDRILAAAPIIKACALGLRQVPELNGHFIDDHFAQLAEVKMGIGIALHGGGLIAPALPQPDTLPLTEVMQRLRDLVARVRGGRLRSSELTEGSVTLSNLGDSSADFVLPVIYPPQVAIIGVGQIEARPWVVNGVLAIRQLATFTIAGDHRANDGRSAVRFLRRVGEILQKPEAL
jgi:pyruvate dehydrogenase E2 component (dihydrolipoamide acetyltransferase)